MTAFSSEQHLVNLSAQGRLQATGALHTPAKQLPQIFAGLAASGQDSLTIFFHGGVTNERAGLELARDLYPELSEQCRSYPVFFIWETGVLETIQSQLMDILTGSPLFRKLYQKLLKHAARKLHKPALEQSNTTAEKRFTPSALLSALERETLPIDEFSSLGMGEMLLPSAIPALSEEESRALQNDLAGDEEAVRLLQDIIAHARSRSGSKAFAVVAQPGREVGYLSQSVLDELLAPPPPVIDTDRAAAAKGPITDLLGSPSTWIFAVRVLAAIIQRFRTQSDHGLGGTVLEELYRHLYADKIGLWLWEEMKENAREAYQANPDDQMNDDCYGGTLFITLLKQYWSDHKSLKVNLIGHSAGSIHICHFIERAAALLPAGFAFENVIFLAPAANFATFQTGIVNHAQWIKHFRIFTMSDEFERRDPLVKLAPILYPHSLLYLVSGLLEKAGPDTPLVGLARHLTWDRYASSEVVTAGRHFIQDHAKVAVSFAVTDEETPVGLRAAFTSHYGKEHGPTYDRRTLESLAVLIRPTPEQGLHSFKLALTANDAMCKLFTPSEPAQAAEPGAKNIIDENEIVDHAIVDGLLKCGRSVARVVTNGVNKLEEIPPDQRANRWQEAVAQNELERFHGTGWIFGKARRVLITNNHVLPLPEAARSAEAEFGYEAMIRTEARPQRVLRLNPDDLYLTSPNMAFNGLDYTMVALSEEAPVEFGYLEPVQGITADRAKSIYVVQHPYGHAKSYIVNHNRKVNVIPQYLTYTSDTDVGSSGAPLFNEELRLVGIHHLGGYPVEIGGRAQMTNLGSRIEAVVEDAIHQLSAKGWDSEQIRHWFGDGFVFNTWQRLFPNNPISSPPKTITDVQEEPMTRQFSNGYALLIAVNENNVPKWSLPVVSKDIEALEKVLIHPERCAYPQENVKVVSGKNATRQGIIDGMKWLKERLSADTSGNATAVIYYSGHGWRDTDATATTYYFIPYDIDAESAGMSALRASDFASAVEKLTPRRLLVILDCCHAGGMEVKEFEPSKGTAQNTAQAAPGYVGSAIPATLFMGTEKAVPLSEGSNGFELLAQGAGRAVLSSSRDDQSSYVRKDGAMSIFTYHLIEALTGHAQPAEGGNDVRVFNLGDYVDRHVPESAMTEWKAQQTPDFKVSGSFPVALVLGGKGLSEGMVPPDPLTSLAPQQPQTGTQINTSGGAYISGIIQVDGNFAGRDMEIVYGEKVHGDKVGGDKISVGNVSGTGIAIGRGARARVEQGITGDAFAKLFQTVYRRIETRLPDPNIDKEEIKETVSKVEAEVAKGDEANSTKVERWLNTLADLAPDVFEVAVTAIVSPAAGVSSAVKMLAERLKTHV